MLQVTTFSAFTLCLGLIVITLQLLLGCFYCAKGKNTNNAFLKQNKNFDKWHKPVEFFTLTMYTFQSIEFVSSVFISNSTLKSKVDCQTLAFISGLLYHWSKGCLYGLVIARIQAVCSNTNHAYSLHKVILPLYFVLFGYFIVTAIVDYIEMNNYWTVGLLSCHKDKFEIGTIMVIILDVALAITCITLILLLAKRELSTSTVGNNKENKNNNTTDSTNPHYEFSIYKYRRLIFISLISTTVGLAFYLITDIYLVNNSLVPYFTGVVILVNNLINVICIFLFHGEYDNLHKKICLLQFCQSDSKSSHINVHHISNVSSGSQSPLYDDRNKASIVDIISTQATTTVTATTTPTPNPNAKADNETNTPYIINVINPNDHDKNSDINTIQRGNDDEKNVTINNDGNIDPSPYDAHVSDDDYGDEKIEQSPSQQPSQQPRLELQPMSIPRADTLSIGSISNLTHNNSEHNDKVSSLLSVFASKSRQTHTMTNTNIDNKRYTDTQTFALSGMSSTNPDLRYV